MSKDSIALISPYPELSALARKISTEQKKDIGVYTAVLDEGLKLARLLEGEGKAGVFISRGATGALIRAAVTVPLVLVEITPYDVLDTLYRAKQITSKIAFFDYWHRQGKYDFERISAILDIEVHVYYYHSEEELTAQIEQAAADGCEVAVASGICIVNQAEAKGMKGVMINTSKEALQEALLRAEEVILIRKKDQRITERLKTILNHSYGGIIAVDNSAKITHFNPAAEEVLRIPANKVVGRLISDLKNERDLQLLYAAADPVLGDLQLIKDSKYIVSRVPLKLESENFGTVITFQEVQKIQSLEAKIRQKLYTRGLVAKYTFEDIIGMSPAMEQVVSKARKYSGTDATVLITGESGTGKELFAQSIHQASKRGKGPFVAINCAAIPENLLESELFGYEEGAFTGAKKGGNLGLFEVAHGGTLFLDEVLELTLPLQARLLRVLQEKAVRRVGGHRVIPVDVRIVSAANRNLLQAVKEGKFREDLYFRLNILNLNIPPLRDRAQDIPELTEFFLNQYAIKYKSEAIRPISQKYINRLKQYNWPGNVRELESFIEKYVILALGEETSFELIEELLTELQKNGLVQCSEKDCITIPIGTMKEMEAAIISELATGNLDKIELAKKLGVSRQTIWKKLKEEHGC
jgi:transcriptional regulator with PAS, ATPase and Fis domain